MSFNLPLIGGKRNMICEINQLTSYFMGNIFYGLFNKRYKVIRRLLEYSLNSEINIKIHLQLENLKKPLLNIPFFRRFQRNTETINICNYTHISTFIRANIV